MKTCTVDGCDKPLKIKSLGYCIAHYRRHRIGADMTTPIRKAGQKKACSIDSCGRQARCRGMCNAHYEYWRKREGRDIVGPKPGPRPAHCTVDNCESSTVAGEYCNKHYQRFQVSGDPNVSQWEAVRGDLAAKLQASTIRDDNGCLVWQRSTEDGYGRFSYMGQHRSVHRVVWEESYGPVPDDLVIDHRCHNRACCEVEHMRLVTNQQNVQNFSTAVRSNNKSGYRGVHWHRSSKRWVAQVRINGKAHVAGYFDDPEEAGAAAQKLRIELQTHNDLDRMEDADGSAERLGADSAAIRATHSTVRLASRTC